MEEGAIRDRTTRVIGGDRSDTLSKRRRSSGSAPTRYPPGLEIREAYGEDHEFVISLMDRALAPFYGGDHRAHAERIFLAHLSGGADEVGNFSFEQRMFLAWVDGERAGLIHLVGKRQGTYKISPIIVAEGFRARLHLGSYLLGFAEEYACSHGARQMYCTVARENLAALQFFVRHGFVVAGTSNSHYKEGVTEVMLYKRLLIPRAYRSFDRINISVVPCSVAHEDQVRALLLATLPRHFRGIDDQWIDALFGGYRRRDSRDVNLKYKLIFVAVDRSHRVLGVVGATPKKGEPIKLMPVVAVSPPAFLALLGDVPYQLQPYGRKLYLHITPTIEEIVSLQQRGWHLDAALPAAYHERHVTQQWSLDLLGENVMRIMRVKKRFLDLIRSGDKTLEVRVGYASLKTIQPGEHIRLMSRDETETIVVKDVRRYNSFEAMLQKEDPLKIAPDLTPEGLVALLREIYPPDRERLGVIVLDIGIDPGRDGKEGGPIGAEPRRR